MALNRAQLDADSRVGLELGRRLSAANATPEQVLRDIRVITGSTNAEVMKALSGVRRNDAVTVSNTRGISKFVALGRDISRGYHSLAGTNADFGTVFNSLVADRLSALRANTPTVAAIDLERQARVEIVDELYSGLMLRSDLANVDDGVVTEMSKYLSTKLNGRKFDDLEGRPTLRVALSHLNRVAGVGRASLPDRDPRITQFQNHRNAINRLNGEIDTANKTISSYEKIWTDTDSLLGELRISSENLSADEGLLARFSEAVDKPDANKTGIDKNLISQVLHSTGSGTSQQAKDALNKRIVENRAKLKDLIAKIPDQLKLVLNLTVITPAMTTAINNFLNNTYSPNKNTESRFGQIVDEFFILVKPNERINTLTQARTAATAAVAAARDEVTRLGNTAAVAAPLAVPAGELFTAKAALVTARNTQRNIETAEAEVEKFKAQIKAIEDTKVAWEKANQVKAQADAEVAGAQANVTATEAVALAADISFSTAQATYQSVLSAPRYSIEESAVKSAQKDLESARKSVEVAEKALVDARNTLTTAQSKQSAANADVTTCNANYEAARRRPNSVPASSPAPVYDIAILAAETALATAKTNLANSKNNVIDPAAAEKKVNQIQEELSKAEENLKAAIAAQRLAAAAVPTGTAPLGLSEFFMAPAPTATGAPSVGIITHLRSTVGATGTTGLIADRETEINALNGLRVAAPIPYDVEKLVMERIFMGPNAPLLGSLSDEELSKRILIEVNRINYWNMNPVDGLGLAHPVGAARLPGSFDPAPPATPAVRSYTDDQLAQLAELQMLEGRNELKRTGNFAERLAGINDPRLREMLVGKLAVTPQLRAMGIKNTKAWAKLTLQEKIEKSEGKFSTSFKQRVLGMKFIKDSAKGEESPFEGLDTSDLNNWESIERSLASGILSVESAFYLLAALKDFFAGSPFDGESDVNIMENLSDYLYKKVFEEIDAKASTETPVPSDVEINRRADAEFKKRVIGSEKTTKAWLSHYDKNSKDVENNFVKNLNARFKVLKLNYTNGQVDSDEFDRQYKELVDEARERNALKLVDFYSNRRGIGAIVNGFAKSRVGPRVKAALSILANAGVKPTAKLAWDAAKGVKGFAGAAIKGGWGLIWNPIRLVGLTTAGLYNSFADPDDKIKDAAGQTLGVSHALGATWADIKGVGSYFAGAARGAKGSLIGSEVDGKNGFFGDFVGGLKSFKEDREKALEKAEKKLKKSEESMNIGPLDLTGSAPRKAVEAPAPVAQAPAVPEVKTPESASADDLKKVEDYLSTLPKHAIAPLSSMLTSVRTGKKAEAEAYAKVLLAKSIPQEVVNYLQVLTEDQVKQIVKKMTDLKLIGDKKGKSEESAAKAA